MNSSGNEDDLTSTSEGEDGGQGQGQGGGLAGVVAVGVVDDEAFETLTAEIKY